ncbi:uncharacterized protein PV09_02146 [Verruconis gallopava]|uniref:Putative gamma-glutamylcyclotransferase n=1 Tax=Verruconis gallopava TaxID=253628 RepID=A0A0D1XWW4_9PEZI|nr:uncharacterized protein PV09_02146 [Verruconis gallopava]KIW07296.1 hypothetical protein PV09_02146 [Verruconis gallopava]
MDANLLYAYQTQNTSDRPKMGMETPFGPHTAFFYGTLMAPKVLSRVCFGPNVPLNTTKHGKLNIRPALLQNFRRHRVLNVDYPAILPCEGSTVRGTLVSGLTDGDLWRLDIFEGDEYERRKVLVREINYEGDLKVEPSEDQLGVTVEAETYVWIGPKSDLDDHEWDFQEFVRDKMWAWVGSSGEERSDYKDVDDAVRAIENDQNDPTRGRGLDGKIGKALEIGGDKEADVTKTAV